MVSERGLDVLRAIVQDYVASREPVGSKTIVDRYSFGVSAATIRNDMAALEEDGLIAAPHTSSGRVPTDKGYRMFVDHLAEIRALSTAQRLAIRTFLEEGADLDDVLARTVRMLSQLTNQVALVQVPVVPRSYVRHVELVSLSATRLLVVLITDAGRVDQRVVELPPGDAERLDDAGQAELRARINGALVGRLISEVDTALAALADELAPAARAVLERVAAALAATVDDRRQDRLLLAGTANLARTERDFPGSILPVLEAIEEQVVMLRLFREMELDERGVSISIGRENPLVGLAETSILAGGYRSSAGEVARIGVLGPTRMDYSQNIAAVRAVARYLSKLLGEE
ncbi:heat-inducible transcriptional repressor HrcA [Amnibacterium kyonggiense]|uniref:Heat-inducible transcription repressor HrcA n=1 Tax=Amnibacterium kyonggiense TaxID=595671 RepID=A0A4R7FMC5_9MICO|nr:heat-inducible transcriptional repressor HrcA [Amnibacterium kyonggiense]TDS77622.1 heat-inducible transcription repressor HrcA [Amnibacterium kyonggiense]